MRILFLCDTMDSGGAERVISTLSNGFVVNNHEVFIMMLSKEANDSFYKLDDKIGLLTLSKENLKPFKKVKLLKQKILDLKPDLVISFLSYVCIYTWLALRHTNIPYIVSERNDPNHRSKLKQYLLNRSFKRASGCVFQTEDAKNWYSKISKDKSVVIHNPVFLNIEKREQKEVKKQILYVGRLNEQKNCLLLIDSFDIFSKKHPDYILKMYGKGPLENNLKEYINSKGLDKKIVLLPPSKTWHQDEYSSAVFALSSKYEGMPNVLAEALSLGIPSVSTDCTIGGPKELKTIFKNRLILTKLINVEEFAISLEEALRITDRSFGIPDDLRPNLIVEKWLTFLNKIVLREK